jgi:hypothetical protein
MDPAVDFEAAGSGIWGHELDERQGVLGWRVYNGLQRVKRKREFIPVYRSFQ